MVELVVRLKISHRSLVHGDLLRIRGVLQSWRLGLRLVLEKARVYCGDKLFVGLGQGGGLAEVWLAPLAWRDVLQEHELLFLWLG